MPEADTVLYGQKTTIFEKSVSRLPGNTDRPVERHMEESLEDDLLLAYKKYS